MLKTVWMSSPIFLGRFNKIYRNNPKYWDRQPEPTYFIIICYIYVRVGKNKQGYFPIITT